MRSTLRPMRRRSSLPAAANATLLLAALAVLAPLSACSTKVAAGAPSTSDSAPTTVTTANVATTSTTSPPAGSDTPLTEPVAAVPVTASSQLPAHDAVVGLHRIQDDVDACLHDPKHCDVDRLAVPGSPAHRYLDGLLRYYVHNRLVVRTVPELSYVVPEYVRMVSENRAEITLCEVDGSWQMDSRGTRTTVDDIVWDDSLLSRRSRHTLVRSNGVWRRYEIVELQLWLGEQRCPARPNA